MAADQAILPDDLEPTERGTFQGSGPGELAFVRWEHPVPVGRVVILHGYGEHAERYRHVARWLHLAGWSVSAMDQRGFGRSPGSRGDAEGIRGFVSDLICFLRLERHRDAQLRGSGPRVVDGMPLPPDPAHPQVLLGHSFGGLVSLLAALWHPDAMDALMLTAPAIGLRALGPLERFLQAILVRVAPHFAFQLTSRKHEVCSDPVLVQRYWDDPLCHRTITPAFVAALQEGRREAMPHGAELDMPVLLLESGKDTVADPEISDDFWGAVPGGRMERHLLEDFLHEIFHDVRRKEAEAVAETWLHRVAATWEPRWSHHQAFRAVPRVESGTLGALPSCHHGV